MFVRIRDFIVKEFEGGVLEFNDIVTLDCKTSDDA
jgi:hypothetical protein